MRRLLFVLCLIVGTFLTASCAQREVPHAVEAVSEAGDETGFFDIAFSGGIGKASIQSPVEVTRTDGKLTARFVWTSENYDYMIVNGVRYENENEGGPSTFTVEIDSTTGTLPVIGDTVAMSTPHEIEYLIIWGAASEEPEKAAADPDIGGTDREAVRSALEQAGLARTESVALSYATGFAIEKYGDYAYVPIENSGDYLIVPEGKSVPKGLPETVTVLKQPLDRTYLVSTAAMDLIRACGALGEIRLSGTKETDWYIPEARAAMERGDLIYAGKYRAPDYELLLQNECDLAIENTMLYHEPAVKEKLHELGIPVLVETSSYEQHPLGRLEWIKLYGLLFDREAEAEAVFMQELDEMEPLLKKQQDTGKTVAFFHVTANGLINVRKPGDYITKMIELAGGTYVLTGAGTADNALSTMNMQMEEFYAEAAEADIIIYNSTIGGEIGSVTELIRKNALFADFKAVREGNVYCTERNLFQQITGMGAFMQDLNDVFCGVDRDYTYLNRLD